MTTDELCDRVIANEEEAEFLSQHIEGLPYAEQMALAMVLHGRGRFREAESVTRVAAGKLARSQPIEFGDKTIGWTVP